MKMKIKNIFFFPLVVGLLLLVTNSVNAAEIFFEQEKNFGLKDQFKMSVFIETEEPLNAVEGKINFPTDLLDLKNIEDGNSIVNLWLERPSSGKMGEIIFSGITPGGYKGDKGLILSMIFLVKQEGMGIFEIRDALALLNDGDGTEAKIKTFSSKFIVSKKTTEVQIPVSEIEDTDPPEEFRPGIARDELISDGQWFIVFATQDKGSGIDHYEIKRSRQRILSVLKEWTFAESPHVLADQELRSFVWIKAVDKAGNERIVVLAPKYPLKWYENWQVWIIIMLIIMIIYVVRRKKIKKL